jgi:hypothetical protein
MYLCGVQVHQGIDGIDNTTGSRVPTSTFVQVLCFVEGSKVFQLLDLLIQLSEGIAN